MPGFPGYNTSTWNDDNNSAMNYSNIPAVNSSRMSDSIGAEGLLSKYDNVPTSNPTNITDSISYKLLDMIGSNSLDSNTLDSNVSNIAVSACSDISNSNGSSAPAANGSVVLLAVSLILPP